MLDSALSCYRPTSSRPMAYKILAFLEAMHAEVGYSVLDQTKALAFIQHDLETGRVFIVTRGDELVASIGFSAGELWYANAGAWFSRWAYVLPEDRDGPAFKVLLKAVADMVDDDGVPAFIHFYRKRSARGSLKIVADEFAIAPKGHVVAIEPERRG